MTDCGAAGSALDRALGGLQLSSQASSTQTHKAVSSFLGHAVMAGGVVMAMPEAPPRFLEHPMTTLSVHQPQQHEQQQQQQPISAWQQPHPLMQQQHHHRQHEHDHSHLIQQQQQAMFLHSQHQMMMMMQQQQQQLILEQQQQQTAAALKTSEPDHIQALREHVQESLLSDEPLIYDSSSEPPQISALREYWRVLDLKEPTEAIRTAKLEISQQIQEWEQQHQQHGEPTMDNWHDGLDDPSVLGEWQSVKPVSMEELAQAWRHQEQDDVPHEGTRTGATMDDLAAAWAQAEAEYDDDMANNVAGVLYENGDVAGQLQPYVFAAPLTEEQRAVPARNYLEEGLALFDRGETTRAIQSLEMSLQIDPDSAKAWLCLGKAHAEHDEDRKAIACLERAVETDPYATDALLALGVCYVNELNHAKALHNLKQWITHNPNYAGLSTENDLYGGGGSSESELDQVQTLLVTALEVDPTSPEIHEALGVVYNVSREYDAAVASFQTALKSHPDSHSLWNKLGATLANSNQSAEALPHYHEALRLRPKYARVWLNMAISHSNLQHHDEAARCYLQTISLNPGATHCWSYVRIALSCLERWDLLPLVAQQNLKAFQEQFDFVLYD